MLTNLRHLHCLIVFLLLNCTLIIHAQSTNDVKILHSLVYRTVDTQQLTLDLYLPVTNEKSVPCIMVIQGGGFKSQDSKRFAPYAQYLAENSLAAALISYRGLPDHTFPDTLSDVQTAVQYIRKISQEHSIDPTRIGSMGQSAGATLAVLLAVTDATRPSNDKQAPPSTRVASAVGLAGVYDFKARFNDPAQLALQPDHQTKIQSNTQWIGEPFAPDNAAWLSASALKRIDYQTPPILLLHCRDDHTVPWLQSQNMYHKLNIAKRHPQIQLFETGGHNCLQSHHQELLKRIVTFFKETMATSEMAIANTAPTYEPPMKLVTKNYEVTLRLPVLPEGYVGYDGVLYHGVSRQSGNSIDLTGSTWHQHNPQTRVITQFNGWQFHNGDVTYYVSEDGRLTVFQGKSQLLVDEMGFWQK